MLHCLFLIVPYLDKLDYVSIIGLEGMLVDCWLVFLLLGLVCIGFVSDFMVGIACLLLMSCLLA